MTVTTKGAMGALVLALLNQRVDVGLPISESSLNAAIAKCQCCVATECERVTKIVTMETRSRVMGVTLGVRWNTHVLASMRKANLIVLAK
jgi:hypothetical protein